MSNMITLGLGLIDLVFLPIVLVLLFCAFCFAFVNLKEVRDACMRKWDERRETEENYADIIRLAKALRFQLSELLAREGSLEYKFAQYLAKVNAVKQDICRPLPDNQYVLTVDQLVCINAIRLSVVGMVQDDSITDPDQFMQTNLARLVSAIGIDPNGNIVSPYEG